MFWFLDGETFPPGCLNSLDGGLHVVWRPEMNFGMPHLDDGTVGGTEWQAMAPSDERTDGI